MSKIESIDIDEESDLKLASLLLKIKMEFNKIGIIGLGYVGLPLALAFSKK